MTTVGSYEAKTRLAELLERAARGERITITRYGVAVAMLVPIDTKTRRGVRSVIDDIVEFRRGRRLGEGEARQWVDEGRRS